MTQTPFLFKVFFPIGPRARQTDRGGVRAPGGLPRLQSGRDGRSPSGGFDSRPPPPSLSTEIPRDPNNLTERNHVKKLLLTIIVGALVAIAARKLSEN